jgi:hypothetical protein
VVALTLAIAVAGALWLCWPNCSHCCCFLHWSRIPGTFCTRLVQIYGAEVSAQSCLVVGAWLLALFASPCPVTADALRVPTPLGMSNMGTSPVVACSHSLLNQAVAAIYQHVHRMHGQLVYATETRMYVLRAAATTASAVQLVTLLCQW